MYLNVGCDGCLATLYWDVEDAPPVVPGDEPSTQIDAAVAEQLDEYARRHGWLVMITSSSEGQQKRHYCDTCRGGWEHMLASPPAPGDARDITLAAMRIMYRLIALPAAGPADDTFDIRVERAFAALLAAAQATDTQV